MDEICNNWDVWNPYKQWDKLPINWCRISAINSILNAFPWYLQKHLQIFARWSWSLGNIFVEPFRCDKLQKNFGKHVHQVFQVVTFLSASWRSLDLGKGHVFTIPKRSRIESPSRWWQLKYFLCSSLPEERIQFEEHIFQMGWFNHQLDYSWVAVFFWELNTLTWLTQYFVIVTSMVWGMMGDRNSNWKVRRTYKLWYDQNLWFQANSRLAKLRVHQRGLNVFSTSPDSAIGFEGSSFLINTSGSFCPGKDSN